MRYQLDLTLRQAEGALARVLGTAERRGFQPVSVDGETQPDGDRWHLRMTVEGEREPDHLRRQLAKLYDCLAVEVSPCR
jgi:acetolactate synthase II small subunit